MMTCKIIKIFTRTGERKLDTGIVHQ